MPVTRSATVAHTLTKIGVDMVGMTMSAHFHRTIDDLSDGGFDFIIEGDDMIGLLSTQAVAGQPLGAEITDAIYSLAIAKGKLSGVIS